ncbi:MAG: methylated-DNA--[protein]-cysteine S-methyltransferase [Bacteroidota bacterium]
MAEITITTPLGWIQIVSEDNVLTRIHFMDEAPLEAGNSDSFLLECVQQLQQYFDGTAKDFPFLQIARQTGTDFQQRVWSELVKIPYGKTISYQQLAVRLGDEKCIRAAASANGQNNLAIAIPCHRVIGSDGTLTGYAGGLWRKKWLLDHEAKNSGNASQPGLFD